MKNKFKIGILLAVGLLLASAGAKAADLIYPSPQESNVIIGSAEKHHNSYIAGANVTVNGETSGDLAAVGGLVSVDGKVEQDVMAVGGTLNFYGEIGGDARVAGGNIIIGSPIAGDLIIGGGNISLTSKASVGGDLVMGGGNVVINSPIKGQVKIAGGNITINSKIDGNVSVNASQTLVFGPNAEIAGRVNYRGPKQPVIQNGAKVDNIVFTQLKARSGRQWAGGILTVAFLVKLLAWFIAALLLLKLKKDKIYGLVEDMKKNPLANLGWGLGSLIVIPVLCVLLLAVFVGYYLSGILAVSFILLALLAGIISAIALGCLIIGYANKNSQPFVDWQVAGAGVVVLLLLSLIPFLGWLAAAVLFAMVFGSIVKSVKENLNN